MPGHRGERVVPWPAHEQPDGTIGGNRHLTVVARRREVERVQVHGHQVGMVIIEEVRQDDRAVADPHRVSVRDRVRGLDERRHRHLARLRRDRERARIARQRVERRRAHRIGLGHRLREQHAYLRRRTEIGRTRREQRVAGGEELHHRVRILSGHCQQIAMARLDAQAIRCRSVESPVMVLSRLHVDAESRSPLTMVLRVTVPVAQATRFDGELTDVGLRLLPHAAATTAKAERQRMRLMP